MRKIETTINPFKLDEVRDALVGEGVDGMSVSEVKGFDPHPHANWYRGAQYVVSFAPQIKVELVIPDDRLERCLAALRRCTETGGANSSHIVVLRVEDAIQIRTGEHLQRAA